MAEKAVFLTTRKTSRGIFHRSDFFSKFTEDRCLPCSPSKGTGGKMRLGMGVLCRHIIALRPNSPGTWELPAVQMN